MKFKNQSWKKQSNEQRQEVVDCWFNVSPEAATELAISRGLAPTYAWRLVLERGLLPRTYRNYPKHIRDLEANKEN